MTAPFPLATKHLSDVIRELGPFAWWKVLGLNLGLSPDSLEVIENNYRRRMIDWKRFCSSGLKRSMT